MVSVIGEFKQGFVTFFRQTKESAKPARSARYARRGKITRVWRVPLACSLPSRSSYGSVTRSCGAGKRDETPGTSPWEANSRVTYDAALPTREFVERVSTVSTDVTCVLIFDIVQSNMLLLV